MRAIVLLVTVLAGVRLDRALGAENRPVYMYEDTRRLVALVEEAARLVEQKGEQAFAEFRVRDSKWFNERLYLFIYDIDGINLFHAEQPEFIGKNLMPLGDMDGKPILLFITDIGRKPEKDASGWVFYLWPDKNQLNPLWKSSYIRKVVWPGHKAILVGSGMFNIKTERYFVQEKVKAAAELLQKFGKNFAFEEFRNRASPFVFLDTYIFVLDTQGRALVDPARPNITGRDLSNFRDAVGVPTMREVLDKLQRSDDVWVQYLWPRPGAATPSRKLMYARKVKVGTETLIVGSDFFLATPIWMKG